MNYNYQQRIAELKNQHSRNIHVMLTELDELRRRLDDDSLAMTIDDYRNRVNEITTLRAWLHEQLERSK